MGLTVTDSACLFEGCGRKIMARGLCSGHYSQQYRGYPLSALGPSRRQSEDLTGREFGRLKVLCPDSPLRGRFRWLCECECGTRRGIAGHNLTRGDTLSCGCLRNELIRARALERRSAGRLEYRDGYAYTYARGHPNAAARDGRIAQHRLVMSEHLGRPLLKHENVHHINGDRADNRIENLELWSKSQPAGQRVADKVQWAREILAQYEPELDKRTAYPADDDGGAE